MILQTLGEWLGDKLLREQTLNETISLEEAVSMLELNCFKDAKIKRYHFRYWPDSDGLSALKEDPAAFVKKYFTPENTDCQSTVEHSIFNSGSGDALHRLRFNYSVKGVEHERNSSYSSFIYRNPHTSRCHTAFKDQRKAVIEFYDKK